MLYAGSRWWVHKIWASLSVSLCHLPIPSAFSSTVTLFSYLGRIGRDFIGCFLCASVQPAQRRIGVWVRWLCRIYKWRAASAEVMITRVEFHSDPARWMNALMVNLHLSLMFAHFWVEMHAGHCGDNDGHFNKCHIIPWMCSASNLYMRGSYMIAYPYTNKSEYM